MKNWYSHLFARVYDRFMNSIERSLFSLRKGLLSELQGEILEIGVGTGVNFKFYNDNCNVTAIDPSKSMINRAKLKLSERHNIELLQYGATDDKFVEYLNGKKFDAIVCTLVLCTIPNPIKALAIFHEALANDGKLVILEHVQHQNKWIEKWYNLVNPLWNVIGDGCNLNRHTDQLIKESGFILEKPKKELFFKKGLPFYSSVFVKTT